MVHVAPNTTSLITSKSVSKGGGRAGYRGLVRVEPGAENVEERSFAATHSSSMRTRVPIPIRTWRSKSPTSTSVTRPRFPRLVRTSSST